MSSKGSGSGLVLVPSSDEVNGRARGVSTGCRQLEVLLKQVGDLASSIQCSSEGFDELQSLLSLAERLSTETREGAEWILAAAEQRRAALAAHGEASSEGEEDAMAAGSSH